MRPEGAKAHSNALKGHKRIAQGKRSGTLGGYWVFACALKGHKRIAQGKRSGTLGINTINIPINALKGQKR